MKDLVVAAVDDGHYNLKVDLGKSAPFAMPARIRAGRIAQVDLQGKKDGIESQAEYTIGDSRYTVGALSGMPLAFDGFACSQQNIVLTQHALQLAGLAGCGIHLVTGLPMRTFFGANKRKDAALIDAKVEAFKQVVISDVTDPVVVERHTVVPQAVAAWYDWTIQDGDSGPIRMVERERAGVAIVDIGGRTTDFAILQGGSLDLARSGSIDAGMLDVRSNLREEIRLRFKLDTTPSDALVDEAMQSGAISLYGKQHDVMDLRAEAVSELMTQIRAGCISHIGQGAELSEVVFCGGGASVQYMQEALEGLFAHQTILPDPLFANARGMRKFGQFVAG